MIAAAFAIPGDLNSPTGGYIYDRRVMAALPACGVSARHLPLPDGFPFPSDAALAETARLLAAVPPHETLIIDGLALGVLPPALLEQIAAPIIALLHHPLGLETGLPADRVHAMLAAEKLAVAFCRHVIVTSPTTAETLAELGFAPPPPVTVAIPGMAPARRSAGSADGGEIVSVGSVVPRKGYDILVAALAQLRDEPWRCTIVGSLERDPDCAAALRAQIAREGLEERIRLIGALDADAVCALLGKADIFALPSRYEGYGMAFAEAMAHGLPIVAARAGAVPETVPPEAGLLLEPDNVEAFTQALRGLLRDAGLLRRLADGAWAHAQKLPRWEDTAALVAEVIGKVAR
jgi:glycosyltransferase involved in cell wall biosynthesis